MDILEFEQNLIDAYAEDDELTFESFLIKKAFADHKKAVLMAGDLGQALSRIEDLLAYIKGIEVIIPEKLRLKESLDLESNKKNGS